VNVRTLWVASIAVGLSLALAGCNGSGSGEDGANKASGGEDATFYWISHSSASDPFWIGAAAGANQAAEDMGVTVKTSFHNGDVAAEKEAMNAAIAAGADGIAVASPKDGALIEETQKAKDAGIPVVFFNSDDVATGRDAFVGADLQAAGSTWAQYLVDNDLVQSGDSVWMPVEVPGATYQTEEEKGIKAVFEPLDISYEVFNASGDPAQSLQNMTDYLTANHADVDAIIGMGDMVMSNIVRSFDSAGIEAGSIPVVGWGNTNETAQAVADGYVNAAVWQFPDAQGYMPIALLRQAAAGIAIGFDVPTTALYDADEAEKFVELTTKD
jgi:simple sugar transport system substrate-binding protein